MRKLAKLSIIVLIPIVLGLVLNIVGGNTDNKQMAHIGQMILSYGVPVTMFLLVVIGLILMITGKGADDNSSKNNEPNGNQSDKQKSETEREYSQIADVNSSYRYTSRLKQGDYIGRHAANNYKNSTFKEKILGWLFFGFLMTDFALIFLFGYLRNLTGVIICFSVFAGTIAIAIVTKVILERTSMRAKFDKSKDAVLYGEVKACLLSSVSSVSGAHSHSTTRITGVVYRVIIIAQDSEYTAYSRNFYETGETVAFFTRGGNRATIITDVDLTE